MLQSLSRYIDIMYTHTHTHRERERERKREITIVSNFIFTITIKRVHNTEQGSLELQQHFSYVWITRTNTSILRKITVTSLRHNPPKASSENTM